MTQTTNLHPFARIGRIVTYNYFDSASDALNDFNQYRAAHGVTQQDKDPVVWDALKRYLGATVNPTDQYHNGGPKMYQRWVNHCVSNPPLPASVKIAGRTYTLSRT